MVRARITMFNEERGFGFARPVDGGADVFVHRTVLGTVGDEFLQVGEFVNVEFVDAPRGPRAVWLERIDA